jgi:type IV pilus assembly protein PilB
MTSIDTLTGLAVHLVAEGWLDALTAEKTQIEAKHQGLSWVHFLIKNKIFSSDALAQYCAKKFDLSLIDLENCPDEKINENLLSLKLMQHYEMLLFTASSGTFKLGLVDPTDQQAINTAMFYTHSQIVPAIVRFDQLKTYLDKKSVSANLITIDELEEESFSIKEDLENHDEPLIQLLNNLINQAIQRRVSDIHIEPYQHTCRIRYRQNGLLYEAAEIPKKSCDRLIVRLKVLAKLDISERRLPQDGHIPYQNINIRLNTCPTLFGEKVVLRLLDIHQRQFDLHSLGMNEDQKNIFIDKLSKPQGMILVTGPTGSGKTMTLYSALKFLNTPEKNISTAEDPIEIQLPGINQVNIQPKIGLDFSTILRTFLRQDPDVIMVGEIRDTETAHIAIQAAQTGHLVLSTLHTNNSIETLIRLFAMGIPAYHLASSLSLIIAQRLIRVLCHHCKQHLQKCNHCTQGYLDRIGVYELLPITPKLSELILAKANSKQLLATACEEGFFSLEQNGLSKVHAGITTHSELNRVITI